MKYNIKEFNKWVEKIKDYNEINCVEHINKMYEKYIWCLNLISTTIDYKNIVDNELKNAITILKQIIKEAKNDIKYSKTGFCANEGQDRAHIHSIRYLIASKTKNIYIQDKKDNFFKYPINENADIDLENIKLIKNYYNILFQTYKSNSETRIIKLAIIDENLNNIKTLKQYDFVVNLNKIEKVYCKKTIAYITNNYYPFQYDGLKNVNTFEKIITFKKDYLNGNNLDA